MDTKTFLLFLVVSLAVVLIGFYTYTQYKNEKIDERTVHILFGLIVGAVTGLVIYLMYTREGNRSVRKTTGSKSHPSVSMDGVGSIPQINSTLDADHQQIISALDGIYSLSQQHWKTEENMFNEGKQQAPASHPDLSGMWGEHAQRHQDLLAKLVQLKKDWIEHMQNFDKQHFHWKK